jgi:hypothetical protein
MTGTRCYLALLLLSTVAADLPAQVILAPAPPYPGVGFSYRGRHLAIGGFFTTGPGYVSPLGIVQNQVSVQFVTPTVVVAPRRIMPVEEYDLTGVDLDVVPATAIWGEPQRKEAVRPRRPEPVAAPRKAEAPRKVEPAPPPKKIEPPPKKEASPPPPKKPVDDLWEPRGEKAAEAKRLLELGIRAFREQEYGVAGLRFRQAAVADPASSRAFFLLGQAEYALGNYREAVRWIGEGLRLQPDWPAADFHPKDELYAGRVDDWAQQREHLLQTHKLQPDDGNFLFLLGYVDWFGDRRREAVAWLRLARPLLLDRPWVDLFLKSLAAPAPAA